MATKKYRSALIKLYSDQFELHELDGKKVPKTQGAFTGGTTEVLVSLGLWIETFMNIRKKAPLIIEIKEEGSIIILPGNPRDN